MWIHEDLCLCSIPPPQRHRPLLIQPCIRLAMSSPSSHTPCLHPSLLPPCDNPCGCSIRETRLDFNVFLLIMQPTFLREIIWGFGGLPLSTMSCRWRRIVPKARRAGTSHSEANVTATTLNSPWWDKHVECLFCVEQHRGSWLVSEFLQHLKLPLVGVAGREPFWAGATVSLSRTDQSLLPASEFKERPASLLRVLCPSLLSAAVRSHFFSFLLSLSNCK